MPPEIDRPRCGASWYKGHGHGNDYLVFEEGGAWPASPEAVGAVCHRSRGPGADGIVVLAPDGDAFRLRMFNPDGSEFERSGNGLRILASYLHRRGLVEDGRPFTVEVGGDRVEMTVHGVSPAGIYDVTVEMGRASTDPAAVGLAPGALEGGGLPLPGQGAVPVHTVAVGNPHAVVFEADLDEATLARLGPAIATHEAFDAGTNVQLARVAGEAALDVLIWERGVGPTTASGTSACAAAVAAVATGRLPPGAISVRMQGGELSVRVSRDLAVVLRGPVQEVSEGALCEGFVASLAG